jgi:hypothetical protein
MSTNSFRNAVIACATFTLVLIGAAGCIAVGGNEHYTKPTLGRQLMDLKTARDTGAMDAQEYEHAKDDLLHGRVSSAQVR